MKMPCQWLFGRWSPKRTFSTNTLWMPPTVTNVDWALAGLRTIPFRPFSSMCPPGVSQSLPMFLYFILILGMLSKFQLPFFRRTPRLFQPPAELMFCSDPLFLLPSCIIPWIFSQVEYEMIIGPSVVISLHRQPRDGGPTCHFPSGLARYFFQKKTID